MDGQVNLEKTKDRQTDLQENKNNRACLLDWLYVTVVQGHIASAINQYLHAIKDKQVSNTLSGAQKWLSQR